MEIHCEGESFKGNDVNASNMPQDFRAWPAHLELLRFADSASIPQPDMDRKIRPDDCNQRRNKRLTESNKSGIFRSLTLRNKLNGSVISSGNCHFSGCKGVVLLASYPRSGNTLLRTLIERTTSIVTGSDTRPDRTLSRSKFLLRPFLINTTCYF